MLDEQDALDDNADVDYLMAAKLEVESAIGPSESHALDSTSSTTTASTTHMPACKFAEPKTENPTTQLKYRNMDSLETVHTYISIVQTLFIGT